MDARTFAWCIIILTFGVSYEVFVRYVMRAPTAWAFDLSYTMYGALFMMAGAYTLARDGHVRGDFLYRLWPVRVQGAIDLVLFILLFSSRDRADLVRLAVRPGLVVPGDQRVQPGQRAGLADQSADPNRGGHPAPSGHLRGRPLLALHPDRAVAATAP